MLVNMYIAVTMNVMFLVAVNVTEHVTNHVVTNIFVDITKYVEL